MTFLTRFLNAPKIITTADTYFLNPIFDQSKFHRMIYCRLKYIKFFDAILQNCLQKDRQAGNDLYQNFEHAY